MISWVIIKGVIGSYLAREELEVWFWVISCILLVKLIITVICQLIQIHHLRESTRPLFRTSDSIFQVGLHTTFNASLTPHCSKWVYSHTCISKGAPWHQLCHFIILGFWEWSLWIPTEVIKFMQQHDKYTSQNRLFCCCFSTKGTTKALWKPHCRTTLNHVYNHDRKNKNKVAENHRQELWIKLVLRKECTRQGDLYEEAGEWWNFPNKPVYVFNFVIYLQPHYHTFVAHAAYNIWYSNIVHF